MGGRSIESEVSFNSGRTICDHLDTALYEVFPIFQKKDGTLYKLPWHFLHRGKTSDFVDRLASEAVCLSWNQVADMIDIMYLALHGRYGEDGSIQGVLEVLGIPYVGSKLFASSQGMDKIILQKKLAALGIKTPETVCLSESMVHLLSEKTNTAFDLFDHNTRLSFPVIVKPAHEGSSLGVCLAQDNQALYQAILHAGYINQQSVQSVLIQERLIGREFVAVCLQDFDRSWRLLPITEIIKEVGTDFYDYDQKYMPGRASKITPAAFSPAVLACIEKTVIKIATALDCSTIIRIDGFVTQEEAVVILDLNTLPGTAPASFIFHQAAEIGMSHTALINHIITRELYFSGMMTDPQNYTEGKKDLLITDQKKIRVAVLLGGVTHEREISLESGRNVCYKLSPEKYKVDPLFVTHKRLSPLSKNMSGYQGLAHNTLFLYKLSPRQLLQNSTRDIESSLSLESLVAWSDLPQLYDFIFIALHGGAGENGAVQGMLEMLNLPYNGSGIHASALCMDKIKSTEFLRAAGNAIPDHIVITKSNWLSLNKDEQEKRAQEIRVLLGGEVVLKPHDDGCSVLVTKAADEQSLQAGLLNMFSLGKDTVLIEEYVRGIELTCGVIGNETIIVMPPSEVVSSSAILSLEEKFLPGQGENQTPARLSDQAMILVKERIKIIYQELGCKGYARIDCFYQDQKQSPTGQERLVFIECNTLPALTPATCIFHQAAEIGLRPMDFVDTLVQLGFDAHTHQQTCGRSKATDQEVLFF